jgi:hypothetical protein
LRKCDGLTSSAPEKAVCGLAVDINHIPDMSTGNVIAPTECLVNGTRIRVITKLPNSEQSYKGKVKTHNYITRQNQSTTGKL